MDDYGKLQKSNLDDLLALKNSGMRDDAEQRLVDDMIQQTYDHIRQWRDFTNKFHVNRLDIALKDIEFTESDINEAIDYAAIFFGMLSPRLKNNADVVAKIVIDDDPSESELSYNWHAFKDAGLLTKDALLLCFVHELSHEYLRNRRFLLFRNEGWVQELAADYICGAYSWQHHLTMGHYKFAIGQLCPTVTHPDGKMREDAFVYGFVIARDLFFSKIEFSLPLFLKYFPDFIFSKMEVLNQDWKNVKSQELCGDLGIAPVRKRKVDISYIETLEKITSSPKKIKRR